MSSSRIEPDAINGNSDDDVLPQLRVFENGDDSNDRLLTVLETAAFCFVIENQT